MLRVICRNILNSNYMRLVLLLSIVVFYSCENNNNTIVQRQEAIKIKMKEVNTTYYKKLDSLDSIKRSDTSLMKQNEIAVEISSVDRKRSIELLALQKESDSLELELKK